jgi:hypothetical protein
MVGRRLQGLLVGTCACVLASALVPGAGPASARSEERPAARSASAAAPADRPLVLAYYYIWFEEHSWGRAKSDYPELGRYASDDPAVVRQHVTWARASGIDGFIVSWKREERLNRPLRLLTDEAERQGLSLILLYQGLDFSRRPLSAGRIAGDLRWFVEHYGKRRPFQVFGRPAIVWSGTWEFSDGDVAGVRTIIDAPTTSLLLGSEKSAKDYAQRSKLLDGNAYYWSSVDPNRTPGFERRLNDLRGAVRADAGIFFAPVVPGFDARLVGGRSIVDRRDGGTYRASWEAATALEPDALAIISWNEFSENSHIEPSREHRAEYLELTRELSGAGALPPVLPAGGEQPSPAVEPQASPAAPPVGSVSGTPSPAPRPFDAYVSGLVGILLLGFLALIGNHLRHKRAV